MRKSWVQPVDDLVVKYLVVRSAFYMTRLIPQSIPSYSGWLSTLLLRQLTVVSTIFYPPSTPPITTNILNNYLITNRGCV